MLFFPPFPLALLCLRLLYLTKRSCTYMDSTTRPLPSPFTLLSDFLVAGSHVSLFLRSTKSPLSARPACRFCLCRLSICLAVGVAPLLYLCACTRSYCRFYSHVCVLRCIVVLPVFLVPSSLSLSVSLSLLPEYFPQIRLSRLWLISCLLFNYTQPSFADCRESPLLYMSSIRVASVYLLY